jgi:hypothetical protein
LQHRHAIREIETETLVHHDHHVRHCEQVKDKDKHQRTESAWCGLWSTKRWKQGRHRQVCVCECVL